MSINKPNSQKSFNNGHGKDTKKVSNTKGARFQIFTDKGITTFF